MARDHPIRDGGDVVRQAVVADVPDLEAPPRVIRQRHEDRRPCLSVEGRRTAMDRHRRPRTAPAGANRYHLP